MRIILIYFNYFNSSNRCNLNPLSQKIIPVIRAICVISLNPLSPKIIPVIRAICGRYHSTNHLSMVRVSLEKFTPTIYVCLAPP